MCDFDLDEGLEVYDRQSITVSNAAVGITDANLFPSGALQATKVIVQCTTNAIRFTVDAAQTAPVSGGAGAVLTASIAERTIVLNPETAKRLQMIREGASDAVVEVMFLR